MYKGLFLVLVSAMSFLPAVAQNAGNATSKKQKEIWQRIDALHTAIFNAKDSLALKDLVNDKVTYGHSGGAIEDKALMIQKAVTNPTTYKNIAQENISLRFIRKTAIARLILRATSIDKGIESPLDLSILQVWIKDNGKWQIVARQAVKVPAKTL